MFERLCRPLIGIERAESRNARNTQKFACTSQLGGPDGSDFGKVNQTPRSIHQIQLMIKASPFRAAGSLARSEGTSFLGSLMSLLRQRRAIIAIAQDDSFCRLGRFLSTVRKTSNCSAAARARSAPFFVLDSGPAQMRGRHHLVSDDVAPQNLPVNTRRAGCA